MKKETEVLADMLDMTRQTTKYYFNKLSGSDLHHHFKTERGDKFNSAFWIIAHLTVIENWLILYSTNGKAERIGWGKQYGLGEPAPTREESPSWEEVSQLFHSVHEKSLAHIHSLSSEDLNKPTRSGEVFDGEDSCRKVIMHTIRHEGTHCGHLGWLCKMHGIKTI
jgi:hypothetical protein